ncbi:hypothetical protein BGZ80_007491 [Entomortierella chlamydospora]|uniref:HbrB n=1 Tax=Entomortierella chlamydospora TaxID=101097 RepID=A0A9P6MZI1_9FUNG|nr:hypothetical protein BGZ80_007491 [Entomortierella chlamydospora]
MTSRTPSESNSHYPYIPPPPMDHSSSSLSKIDYGILQSDNVVSPIHGSFPTIRTNTAPLPQSQGSTYLSSPNDTVDGHGGADSPVGAVPSNWPSRSQTHPIVSTSVSSSGGGLTSPASLSSPVNLSQPSPTSQSQGYSLPLLSSGQQSEKKPKKEKHSFGGMSSTFLTETLPATGMKLYPGSKKGAKAHGDISSSSSSSVHNGKGNKKSGPLSSINTRKQQLSPGGNHHHASAIDRSYSSTGGISSPNAGGHHHHTTSPTFGKNNHSSLDAKVMAREMSQGYATEDNWQSLCIKVLTLFNGQGLTGAIEDLNELVRKSLQSRTPFALCDEINELLKNGMLTLNAKLGDVPDEKLVSRLVEVWSFFFGTVLPYFEGVFLPLQIELRSCHARKVTRKTAAGSNGALGSNGGSSGGLNTQNTGGVENINGNNLAAASPKSVMTDSERNRVDSEPENVRTMALTGFRDLVILPMVDRLGGVFAKLIMDVDASIPVTDSASRMIQMTSVLTSIQSGDSQQLEMEQVSNRLKKSWRQITRPGNRGGFVGLERKTTPQPLR